MSLTKGLQMASLAVLTVLTVVLVVLAMTRSVVSSASAPSDEAAAVASARDAAAPVVSVLGDDHVLREGSWFYRSVPAEPGGAVARGVVLAEPGARAADLDRDLAQVAPGDVVLIAAGSNDLARGARPARVVRDLRELVRGVAERDGVPVLTTLPPDDQRSDLVTTVNRRLRGVAASSGTSLIDVHDPVATRDGRWRNRFTADGEYANADGSTRQAEAVAASLPWVLAGASS